MNTNKNGKINLLIVKNLQIVEIIKMIDNFLLVTIK